MNGFVRVIGVVAALAAVPGTGCRAEPSTAPRAELRAATPPTAPPPPAGDRLPVVEPIPELADVLAGFSRGWTLAELRQGRLSFVSGCATPSRLEITTDRNGLSFLVWDYGEAAETFTIHEAERLGGAAPRVSLTVHSTERRGSGLSVLELAHVDPKAGTARWTVVQGKLALPRSGVWVSDAAKARYPVTVVACPKE